MTQTWVLSTIRLSQSVELATTDRYGLHTLTPDTIRWMNTAVQSLSRFLREDAELTAITPRQIHQWQTSLAKSGTVSPITANSYLRGIKTLYGRLQKQGHTPTNPAEPVKYLPEPQPNPKAITEADYRAMRNVCDGRNRAIVSTLWATGCRVGGLLSMDVNKLDVWHTDGRLCYAVLVKEKFSKTRWVYLADEAAQDLAEWLAIRPPAHCPAIFTTRSNGRLTRNGLNSLLRHLRLAAQVNPDYSNPHAFRHAFALRKLDEGYDLATVSQWLGHSSPEFTAKVYCIRSEKQLRARFFDTPNKR